MPGAVSEFTSSIFGLIVGRIAEHPKVGFRTTGLVGAAVFAVGYLGASFANFSTQYALVVFCQGFLVGLGSSFNYFALLGMIPQYFQKEHDWRTAAFGIAIAGTGCGGFTLAAATQAMITAWGVPWALRATGIIGGSLLPTLSRTLTKRRPAEAARMTIKQIIFFKPFLLCCAIIFFLPFGSLAPPFFGPSYAQDVIGMSAAAASYAVMILNISSTVGRAAQGFLADKIGGPTNNLVVCVFFAGFLQLVFWPFATTPASFAAYMALQGLVGGGYNGLLPTVISANFDENVAAGSMSMAYSFFAWGGLFGPIIQGIIVDHTGSYVSMMMFSGSVVLAAFFFALWLRMVMTKGKLWVNV
ncbi:major facilitator superfamily domain-containing protein [Hyaloraphidium curvatum]|nr:major facilitator superfamily domain-containing protein [Hyaloraphidium curvatum]